MAPRSVLGTVLVLSAALISGADYMDCGEGVGLCGVLVLESGLGSGNYNHSEPVVHGLWPETSGYGDSKCVAPADTSDPSVIYSCYQQAGETDDDLMWFESHEWEKHGVCAGVTDAEDFFTQVCDLASAPLSVMNTTRNAGGGLEDMSNALADQGYSVFYVDTTYMQVELSACAGPDGQWVLSAVDDFATVCGGWTDDGDDSSDVDSCQPNTHGPVCAVDADCVNVTNCLRCAGSGYCTDVPLTTTTRP